MPTKVDRFECNVCHYDGWHSLEEAKKCEDTPVEEQLLKKGEEISWIDYSPHGPFRRGKTRVKCVIVETRPRETTHEREYVVRYVEFLGFVGKHETYLQKQLIYYKEHYNQD